MSESLFQGFGQFSRPDVGLISDSFQNLSEIFESDKRQALRNVLINPEVLDNVYGLSQEITREDLRSASGLSALLLTSLHQLSEVFLNNIPTRLFIDKEFFNPDLNLGGPGSANQKTPNVILFNGSIQCQGVRYVANTIGDRLFTLPKRTNVFLSSSRASLFNSEADEDNPGYFKTATFPGSIRVRRRSHVNRIFLPRDTFLTKAPVVENPSHTVSVNIDNGNTGTETEVKLLSTKNSPLRLLCRLSKGSIKFTFADSLSRYFFGYQIQPLQQRRNRPRVDFLPVVQVTQPPNTTEFTLDIDISGTGFQNLFDVYLYLYVNPEKVTGLEFSGIQLKEDRDGKDIGLVGFNNLETLKIENGSLTVLPLWLKTLSTKLRTLDLSRSGDTWRAGPMGWFDIRDPSATPSFTHPLYTCVSYLTIPKKGVLVNETGDDWSDEIFEKYILDESRTAGTDYREFSSVRSIALRDRFLMRSPRFDDVFPNLTNLNLARIPGEDDRRDYRYLFGTLPRINNNGSLISYNIYGSQAAGDITEIGTSTDPEDPARGHISQYSINSFNVGGREGNRHDINGYINDPEEDWSAWREVCLSINGNRSNLLYINLQDGEWSSLTGVDFNLSNGGVKFKSTSAPLLTPKLTSLGIYGTASEGKFPSLGSNAATHTGALQSVNFGGPKSLITAYSDSGINFALPTDFAPSRAPGNEHRLESFSMTDSTLAYKFRQNDWRELYNLREIRIERSQLTGRFPLVPATRFPEFEFKDIRVVINNSRFYDLTNLSISQTNSVFAKNAIEIIAWGQNSADGGSLLPSFEGASNTRISVVDISNSLTSTYRGDWFVPELRGSVITEKDPATELTGLSITRKIPTQGLLDLKDSEYVLSGGSGFRQRVLVNDSVRLEELGVEVARVLSVNNTEIIIDRDIPGTLPSTVYFTRNNVSINGWFRRGFSELKEFRCANNRLSGTLDIRSGFTLLTDSSLPALDLSRNFLSGYEQGTLSKIFSGNNRKITINLFGNNFSIDTIRTIITEVIEIENLRRFTNCVIRLDGNKLTAGNKYSQYTQQEIFPVIVSPGNDIVTLLNRSETFNSYRLVKVTNEFGEVSEFAEPVGTRTLSMPGALISGNYFKTKRDKTQEIAENTLAARFKTLRGVRVLLGFAYVSPTTGTSVVSTSYEDQTTRFQSVTDSGLELLPSCPSGISGTCWKRPSDGLILQL
jgi:hypothetical protein